MSPETLMLLLCRKEHRLLLPCSLLPFPDLSLVCVIRQLRQSQRSGPQTQQPRESHWAPSTDKKIEIQRSINTSSRSCSNENPYAWVHVVFNLNTLQSWGLLSLLREIKPPRGPVYQLIYHVAEVSRVSFVACRCSAELGDFLKARGARSLSFESKRMKVLRATVLRGLNIGRTWGALKGPSAQDHSGAVSGAGSRRRSHFKLPGNSHGIECSPEGVILNSGWVFQSPFWGGP